MRVLFARILGLTLLLATLVGADARAAASDVATTDFTTVRLISGVDAVGDGQTVPLGLHFTLKKGWKVYWRSPGDAGFPPSIKWDGSQNLKAAAMAWPAPVRFQVLGLQTLGYTDEVVYPITATLAQPGKAATFKAAVSYLACSEICIPFDTVLTLTLPQGRATPAGDAHLINRFQTRVPLAGPATTASGIAITSTTARGEGKDTRLIVTATATPAFGRTPDLFVEGPNVLAFDPPKIDFTDGRRSATFTVPVFGIRDLGDTLVGANITLTLADGARAIEVPTAVAAGIAAAGNGNGWTTLATILALAVLGGLILNLMPCVLPVLSLKLLGAIGHGGGEARTVRLSFVASAAGILFAFLVLASALAALKAGGLAIGWGIQFQQPWFLIAMTLIVVLFACNLWGFFEVRLPHVLSDIGEHQSHVHGLGGHFLQGVFATLLATPCSAPFLGTAVGFALSRGFFEIYAVFAALGLGLAAPFLLVALRPTIATRLPKPGPWMITLKRVLGAALAATGIWLLSVLYAQVSAGATMIVAALMVLVMAVLYQRHRQAHRTESLSLAVLAVLAVAAFATPLFDTGTPSVKQAAERIKGIWQPFEPDEIPKLVAQGKTVFVDVTADWCITCQVNKALVLSKDDAFAYLSRPDVIAMQADWTRPDATIAAYLAAFGRYGIPFNAVYGPGTPKGRVLPELLTTETVLDALTAARAR